MLGRDSAKRNIKSRSNICCVLITLVQNVIWNIKFAVCLSNDLNFYSLNWVFKMEFRIRKFSNSKNYSKWISDSEYFQNLHFGLYSFAVYRVKCLSQSNVSTQRASIGCCCAVDAQNASFENFQILKFILNNFWNLKNFRILNSILKTQFKL